MGTPHGVHQSAAMAADRAAERAGSVIRLLDTLPEFEAGSQLIARIWGDREPKAPAGLLRALSHAGNFVAGAFSQRQLVGISVGFFGLEDAKYHLHSHITGVDPSFQGRSLAFALKQFQRRWALERGAQTIHWTTDPLVRRNVFFSLVKLGATIIAYHNDFYGPMFDGFNAGEETDRVVVRWDLTSDRSIQAANGAASEPTLTEGSVILREEGEGEPAISGAVGGTLLAWIPEDIIRIREHSPESLHAWRRALRQTVGRCLSDGYRAETITRDGWFILTR